MGLRQHLVPGSPFDSSLHQWSPILTLLTSGGLGNKLFQLSALLSAALEAGGHLPVVIPDESDDDRNKYYHNTIFRKLRPLIMNAKHIQRSAFRGLNCHDCGVTEIVRPFGRFLVHGVINPFAGI